MRRWVVAGNWKMNTTRESAVALATQVADGLPADRGPVEVLVAPPFPYLISVHDVLSGRGVRLAAQNCWNEPPGAFTGEVAVQMLRDAGCDAVILGHSERRHVLGETDDLINRKLRSALEGGLEVIFCVGELLREREADQTEAVLDAQMAGGLEGVSAEDLARIVVAYEPVWAIGTGKTAAPDQAESAHAHLRKWLSSRYNSTVAEDASILYGGSVKPDNALSLMEQPNVDGALVGGASLESRTFLPIVQAAVEVAGR